ncbi:FprA family A-type flavoprotein [Desulforhopalus sp. IMCC35007]|uniref:FprA family A-type flavoprotein n=1 Tax=Desulforhopalus sp. IMCC35007 TaxID=2569543 RepID=UPI0010AE71FC|nr:flavodoxin domain-containing protein [Desulforhopalus sp. IMCC35007]TKB09059.1 MBL fold metallo-hydrolase [Desulforhopalus sp. IMCC35007]
MSKNELAKGIHWVGAVDWDIRDFHGYSTYKGTTYNAFLVIDEKVTLFDTVKHSHKGELLRNIRAIIDPEKIDYIVVNHVEMDHSGSLPELVELIKPEKVFCSPMGQKAILDHFHRPDWPFEVVKSGDEVSLGKRTVQFIETRMLHWPDSMFSFLKEDGILFSSDAFGQHLASSERFDDEVDLSEVMKESAKYYANILYLFAPLIQKLLASVAEMNLNIKMIAPDHGVIWRTHQSEILAAYDKWSRAESDKKALVIYDSMWHSTEEMAHAVSDGLLDAGVSTNLVNLQVHHRSDVMTQVLGAKAVVLGSSTLNNGLLPRMAGFLMYMRGLKPTNKIGATFGSFGWSGEAVSLMNKALEEMKINVIEDGMKVKYVPDEEKLEECREMGRRIGKAVCDSFDK